MFYKNELLFNNAFLNSITPSEGERGGMYSLLRSARDWYRQADFTNSETLAASFLRPLLQNQSLDLALSNLDPSAFFLVAPWEVKYTVGISLCCARS